MDVLWETTIDPANSDVALYIFGLLILLCLAVMAWNKVYEWKQKWKKRRPALMKDRRRYTVRYAPTGAGKAVARAIGVLHAIIGTVFFLIGLGALPYMWLFGLIFAAVGGLFAVNGTLIALGKNGLGRSYQIETEEHVPTNMPRTETHDHISSTALDTKRRLEQLESLKSAGLIDGQEYRQKREQILKEL